jgi:hypothetical protein
MAKFRSYSFIKCYVKWFYPFLCQDFGLELEVSKLSLHLVGRRCNGETSGGTLSGSQCSYHWRGDPMSNNGESRGGYQGRFLMPLGLGFRPIFISLILI